MSRAAHAVARSSNGGNPPYKFCFSYLELSAWLRLYRFVPHPKTTSPPLVRNERRESNPSFVS